VDVSRNVCFSLFVDAAYSVLVAYKPVPHDSYGFAHTNYYTGTRTLIGSLYRVWFHRSSCQLI